MNRKRRQLEEFQEKQGIIEAGAANLRTGLRRAAEDVDRANRKAFIKIASEFTQLFSRLVPSKEGTLRISTSSGGGGNSGGSCSSSSSSSSKRKQAVSSSRDTLVLATDRDQQESQQNLQQPLCAVEFVIQSRSASGGDKPVGDVAQLSGGQQTLLGIAVNSSAILAFPAYRQD